MARKSKTVAPAAIPVDIAPVPPEPELMESRRAARYRQRLELRVTIPPVEGAAGGRQGVTGYLPSPRHSPYPLPSPHLVSFISYDLIM